MRQVAQTSQQQSQQPGNRPGQQWAPSKAAAPKATKSGRGTKIIVSIEAVVIVVAVLVIVGLSTSWFGLAGTKGTTTTDDTAEQSVESDSAGLPIKASVNDYTWDELSAISNEISKASDEAAAIGIAEKYNLCSPDGKLDGTQTKSVTLSGGMQAEVQIAGFYHDDKSDGSGKAGITFIFKDAVAEHAMNPSDTNSGGWKSSEMRSWLSSDFMEMLPADLSKDIVTVDKLSNNTGETTDTSSVTVTRDAVWLFSSTELCGSINWYDTKHDYCNDILNAEGTEYQLFRDGYVDSENANGILTKNYLPEYSASGYWIQGDTCEWWARSANPNESDIFKYVYSGGSPDGGFYAHGALGVVPGFCI